MTMITQRIESYELILSEKKEVYSLSDIRFLRDKIVHGISAAFEFAPGMYSFTDKALLSFQTAKSIWITLVDVSGKTILQDYPLMDFYVNKFYIPGLKIKIDLNKSFIKIKNQTALAGELNTSIVLTFLFNERPLAWKKNFELKSEQVSVDVNDITQTKFYLQDIESLRGKKLKAIQYDNNTQQLTINGKTKISTNAEYSSYLVLHYRNSPVIRRIPLYLLDYDNNIEENKIIFDDINVDLVHSYVEIAHTAYNIADTAYFFNWYYID